MPKGKSHLKKKKGGFRPKKFWRLNSRGKRVRMRPHVSTPSVSSIFSTPPSPLTKKSKHRGSGEFYSGGWSTGYGYCGGW